MREVYRLWRPTPLFRAVGLEEALKTPAKIYCKYEGVSPPGMHRLTTETGAGQWGSALAFASMFFGMQSTVYMVRASYYQKSYGRVMMETWGAEVFPSPSQRTKSGKKILENDPDCSGSLGISISEAVEDAVTHPESKYTLGSVVNHVLLHQTVVGQETQKQMKLVDDYPDLLVGCVGGGSSFSGVLWPFYYDKVSGKAPKDTEFVAAESTAAPSVTKGYYTYDHGDSARMIPLVKMHTLGHMYIPPPIHAGGLRYHGTAPTLCLLNEQGIVESKAYNQIEAFEAATLFTRTEGILPAQEPAHAIKAVIDEDLQCKETGEEKTIVSLLCGHGHFDMQAYDDYNSGKLPPYEYPKEKVDKSIRELKELYPWLE